MTEPKKDWGMTWDEYKELVFFCRQYDKKRRDADAMLTLRVSTPEPVTNSKGVAEFMPHGSGGVSDPVAMAAERRERLLRDVRMIEKAAAIAGADLAPWLLKCVTQKSGVRGILADCPASERSIYKMRRRFYWILKGMREMGL